MHSTAPETPEPELATVTRHAASPWVVFAAGAAVASLMSAGLVAADDDVVPGLHRPPAQVGGGVWGGATVGVFDPVPSKPKGKPAPTLAVVPGGGVMGLF